MDRLCSPPLKGRGQGWVGPRRAERSCFEAPTPSLSVGMFEHVGPPHYAQFFAKCRSLLVEDGVMLLHTIGRTGGPGRPNAWTAKYIFPGAYHPALSEIVAASERTRMIVADVETLRLHYAYTPRHWYRRVANNRAEITRLYDERFLHFTYVAVLSGIDDHRVRIWRHGELPNIVYP